jgi:putative transposase
MTYYTRNLPHWQQPEADIFITWRLHGSLPARIRFSQTPESIGKRFISYDRALDAARVGPLWLHDPRIADCVIATLEKANAQGLFQLRSYVVMANHVHVLLTPLSPIAEITQRIKGPTSRRANLILSHTGTRFWQDESFDRWVRNPGEWQRIRAYIERNPVAAGLVKTPQEWPWSSASRPIL